MKHCSIIPVPLLARSARCSSVVPVGKRRGRGELQGEEGTVP